MHINVVKSDAPCEDDVRMLCLLEALSVHVCLVERLSAQNVRVRDPRLQFLYPVGKRKLIEIVCKSERIEVMCERISCLC